MKKILIILVVAILLFSGCIDQKTGNQKIVKIGDNVTIDYIGSLNGKVFDTSIESVAKENNIYKLEKTYKPINFIVGRGMAIKGIENGVIGMRIGESRTLTVPPEDAYGQKNPNLIQIFPIIQYVPVTRSFPKTFEMPVQQFNLTFGDHRIGEEVRFPGTNVNVTVLNKTSSVSLLNKLMVGYNITGLAPWNETVVKIDGNNITVRSTAKKNDIIQVKDVPWNTTVIDINSENMTFRHNPVPDTKIKIGNRYKNISFNETNIMIDNNYELAGETLVFNVTIKSID